MMGRWTEKAKQVRENITTALGHLTDEQRLEVVSLHPRWEDLTTVNLGEVVQDNGHLWRCEQPSLAVTPEWRPSEDLPALWTKLQPEQAGGGIIDWFVPTSTNYYKPCDLMRYTPGENRVYESSASVPFNVYKPEDTPGVDAQYYPQAWIRREDLD